MTKTIELTLWALTALFLLYGFWNGWKIKVGKPGDESHILIEFYAVKRLFK